MTTKRPPPELGSRPSEGQRLFARFHRESDKSLNAIAKEIGVSGPTVHDWIWARKSPSVTHRRKVEAITCGLIPAASWETADVGVRRIELLGAHDSERPTGT
jgi:hypothetical protein